MHLLDELYPHAVHVVTTERKAATSFIQRKLQIGYNTAAALMERMEANGVVSAANHVGKRDILIDAQPAPESAVASPPYAQHGEGDREAVEGASEPEAQPEPQPEPDAPYSGPTKRFTCDGCDTEATGPVDGLPRGWWTQTSGTLGTLYKCQTCAARNASRIATEHMTMEQIMSAGADGAEVDVITSAAQNRIKSFVQRILRLREDARAVSEDMKEVSKEAKGEGFDWPTMMKVAREAEKDPQKRKEADALFASYGQAFGLEI